MAVVPGGGVDSRGPRRVTGSRPGVPEPTGVRRVGWRFVALYTLAYTGTCLVLISPLLITLALKVDSLVGIDRAPDSLALVAGVGALVALVANPFFGRMSDRTVSRFGRRRPWMVLGLVAGCLGTAVVALAPAVPVVLVGWCLAQVGFNALLAALVAVLPDQVPTAQRGLVAGALGVCVPVASVTGTFLVDAFTGNQLAQFGLPCVVAGSLVLLFAATTGDRRLAPTDRPPWSPREFARTFYLSPRTSPDFAWAFASRFLFVLAYALLVTYQAYYLLQRIGSTQDEVPRRIFLSTLVMSAVVVAASLVGGRLSDRTGRRKAFVVTASAVFGLALLLLARADTFPEFLVGMAVVGLGFGAYTAVDLALVVDVLPDRDTAKNLGVLNIAGALPFSVAPAIAPAVLAISGGSYAALYAVAGVIAVVGAFAILPVRRVR